MQYKHLIKSLAILVLGLFATASYAAGQATGVSVPPSAAQGSTVRITVNGKGACSSMIRFGDGRSSTISSQVFPHRYTHRYTRTGTKTINAKIAGAGCSSRAPLTARIRITARTTKLPNISKPPIRKIPSYKLQPKRFLPPPRIRGGVIRPAAVMCAGRRATIVGTPGNDTIDGTLGNDVIHGLGGNDVIYGGGGNDIICGGYGNDKLYGGSDIDWLHGGPGNDQLYGEAGNDVLYGGLGYDRCDGGPGSNSAGDSSCETRSNMLPRFTILP